MCHYQEYYPTHHVSLRVDHLQYQFEYCRFRADRRKIAYLITPLVLGADAFECCGINSAQIKGREGWLELLSHCNGSTESELRISAARHKLSNLFYKNEITFNFEIFSTRLKDSFETMDNYGEVRSE